jgi:two-component system, sensor histidine kinase and response regulator
MFDYKPNRPKVMLVDDKVRNLILIKKILESLDLDIYIARNGKEAIKRANEIDLDMILLDILMPDIDGYKVCRQIKNTAREKDLSILFMSALRTQEDKIKGFESGADDYIVKPLYEKEVLARVQLHLKKRWAMKHLKTLLKRSYHELYNPLSVIKTSAEMYGYHHSKNRYVDTMYAASKSLHLIYEDLYYALGSTKEPPISEEIDIVSFLQKRIEYFALIAEVKKIRIELEAQSEYSIKIVSADLQRIIDNTISNAIKYSYENTSIRITLSENPKLKLRISNRGNTIINPHYIFTEGYREAYDTIGMGIGLEIVASICKRHNIDAHVTSDDGITTFSYTFMRNTNHENYHF